MSNGYGVLFVVLLVAMVLQFIELLAIDDCRFKTATALGTIRLAILGLSAVAMLFCTFSKDMTLTVLDSIEINMIRKYRAEQAVIVAQQELRKLQTGKENDDVK